MKPSAMAQAYNPSYSEGSEIGRIAVQGQLGQKFPRPHSPSLTGSGGALLLSQLLEEAQIRGFQSRPA
jgi:hypothetical protein